MTIQEIKSSKLLLLECISGSKAYGLATEKSDTDLRGVFYMPKEGFYGLSYVPQVSNDTNDEVYYELGRFMELLLKNNPNILELLATPQQFIQYEHPLIKQLTPSLFLSRLCKNTFAGYAFSQIKKATGYNKKLVNPIDEERKSVLDFCTVIYNEQSLPLKKWLTIHQFDQDTCGLVNIPHVKDLYALYYDATNTLKYNDITTGDQANDVCLSTVPPNQTPLGYLSFNKDGYSIYCKKYREYQEWVDKRNEDRYALNQAHGKNYDAKNMMHTIRLLQMGKEILQEGRLNVYRTNREELLDIKSGKFSYDELLEKANQLMEEIEIAELNSPLPSHPDKMIAENLLIEIREALYS